MMHLKGRHYLALAILAILAHLPLAKVGYPVILVPGLSDSQLNAKVSNGQFSQDCSSIGNSYVNVWMNFTFFTSSALSNCARDLLSLQYDQLTISKSPYGVDVQVAPLGNTTSVEWDSPNSQISQTLVYNTLVNALVSKGYVRGVSVLGAPYDFRKSLGEFSAYFSQLKSLVESAYTNNGRKPVVLVAHSMGCPLTTYFLSQQNQFWKNTYIMSFVALAGPWGGIFKPLLELVTGTSEGFATPLFLRSILRTHPSIYFLLPNEISWSPTEKLVVTPKRSYTIRDYVALLKDMNFTQGIETLNAVQKLPYPFEPPGVDFYCIHGKGVPTRASVLYNATASFPDTPSEVTTEDGDGTIRLRSLMACDSFKPFKMLKKFEHIIIPGMEHQQTIFNTDVINYILNISGAN